MAAAVQDALNPLPCDSATVHRRLERLGVRDRNVHVIRSAVSSVPLPDERREAARSLARELTRSGTTVPAVTVGLYLLVRLGEPEDIPYLSVLGLCSELAGPAMEALNRLDVRAAALTWLVYRTAYQELLPLVRALWSEDRDAICTELVACPDAPRVLCTSSARRIAEAAGLADLLDRYPTDPALLARAARVLARMGCSNDDPTELLAYGDAIAVYERVVGRVGLVPPTLAHHASLLSLAFDLSSGAGVLLSWAPGQREELLSSLGRLLAEPRWVSVVDAAGGDADQRLWTGWIRRMGRQPFEPPAVAGRLRIEVVAGDPVDREPVETRVLVDGRPVVPAVFSRGPAGSPEALLDEGALRAEAEPREVKLAEAYCSDECCGALHVTIRREGDDVVWDGWRRPPYTPGTRDAPELPAYRFDAAAYDAELARAEADRSWSWPARTIARLIKAGLTERPEILRRWDARRGWTGSDYEEPDTTVVTFWYAPGLTAADTLKDALQFRWRLPDDGSPPESQAAAALRRLTEEDPKAYAKVCGGSPERAKELGFPWPG
ncbi:hypothetical protein ACFT7S_37190 [Streptomyces sp. NPDC057136]|uniref:hypothetical protein n=1 Tax=Streptomyces sp. NPDC057136 TaxID=3346029 RepID=UPI003637B9A7